MSRKATETIRVTPENWEKLNSLKKPGDTFDDVISRLLEADEEADKGNSKTPATAD
jgi:predicted CopG family antitoxin